MRQGQVPSAPYVLGFHDKDADVREVPTDATVNKIGALVRLEALQHTGAAGGPPADVQDPADVNGVEPFSIETDQPFGNPAGPGEDGPTQVRADITTTPDEALQPEDNGDDDTQSIDVIPQSTDNGFPSRPIRPGTDGPDTSPIDGPPQDAVEEPTDEP